MEKRNVLIKSADVENIITKFYFKEKLLCFQVILNLASQEKILVGEFEDYVEYQQKFKDLIYLKKSGTDIYIKNAISLHNFVTVND